MCFIWFTKVTLSRALSWILKKGDLWGGPYLLVMLQQAPGLTCPTDRGSGAAYDDRAALMEHVSLTAGQEDTHIVELA